MIIQKMLVSIDVCLASDWFPAGLVYTIGKWMQMERGKKVNSVKTGFRWKNEPIARRIAVKPIELFKRIFLWTI